MLQYSLFDDLMLTLKMTEHDDPHRLSAEELRALAPRTGFRRNIADALVGIAIKLDRGAGEQLHAERATARG